MYELTFGEVLGEDVAAPLVGFGLEGDRPSCALEAEVEASDSAEQGPGIHANTRWISGRSDGRHR
jgi:hypothetical protein